MGMVASCSAETCSGSLRPLFNEQKEEDGYACERCGIIYERIEQVDERPVGVEPIGRLNQLDEMQKMKDSYEERIREQRERLDRIAEIVANDKTPLAKAIRAELAEKTGKSEGDAA